MLFQKCVSNWWAITLISTEVVALSFKKVDNPYIHLPVKALTFMEPFCVALSCC